MPGTSHIDPYDSGEWLGGARGQREEPTRTASRSELVVAEVLEYWEVDAGKRELLLRALLPFYLMSFKLRPPLDDLTARSESAFSWLGITPVGIVAYSPVAGLNVRQDRQLSLQLLLDSRFGRPTTSFEKLLGPTNRPFVDASAVKAQYLRELAEFPEDVGYAGWNDLVYLLRTTCDVLCSISPCASDLDPQDAASLVELSTIGHDGNPSRGIDARNRPIYLISSHPSEPSFH